MYWGKTEGENVIIENLEEYGSLCEILQRICYKSDDSIDRQMTGKFRCYASVVEWKWDAFSKIGIESDCKR